MILILGVVFSFSRGGLAALTLGFGMVVAIAALRARGHGRRSAAVLLLVAVAVAIAGTGQLVSQWMYMLHPKLLQADARWPVWSSAWGVVADHPLLGVGLGAFPTAFLPYARQAFEAFFMDAHSEPLQLAIEIGLPATVALYAGLLVWIGRAFGAAKSAQPGVVSTAALAGIAGSLTAFVLISLVDFPFHVPSNTLIAFTLAGYAQAGAKEILAG
jgi:O-antigen ligase